MKKIKGFTLIECIVALAILGIASLVMAQIYANVSRINRFNHNSNASLSYQMKYVEEKEDLQAVKVEAAETSGIKIPPHTRTGVNNVMLKTTWKSGSSEVTEEYSFAVDYFVLMSRDKEDDAPKVYDETSKTWKDNPNYDKDIDYMQGKNSYTLNYKYLKGHK